MAQYIAVATTGFLCGVLVTSLAWYESRPEAARSTQVQFQIEQEHLRDRAAARGDLLAEFVHGKNAADTMAGKGFRWLERQQNSGFVDHATYPLMLLALYRNSDVREASEKLEKGGRISEALTRGQAALVLEELKLDDEANKQWQAAHALVSEWKTMRLREVAESFRGMQTSPLSLINADVYLGAKTDEELSLLLSDARMRLLAPPSE